jgi:Fe2+ transport system protein FeoA
MSLPPAPAVPLDLLRPGESGDIIEVSGAPAWVSRMAELGLRAGSRVRLLRSGRPCLLEVGGSRLSLRGECAVRILVQPVAGQVV